MSWPQPAVNTKAILQNRKRPFPGDEFPPREDISRFKRVRVVYRQERIANTISRPPRSSDDSPEGSKLDPAKYYDREEPNARQTLKETIEKLEPEDLKSILATLRLAGVLRIQRKFEATEMLLRQASDLQQNMCNPTSTLFSKILDARITVAKQAGDSGNFLPSIGRLSRS